MAEIISASDIGIIPGVYTKGQLAVKFFEYCSCGIPVLAIAPDNSEIAKIINENKIGLTMPSTDENKLAKSLLKLYADNTFRVEAGKRARTLIEEKFDRTKTAKRYLDKIKILVSRCS